MKKKILAIFAAAALCVTSLSGCGGDDTAVVSKQTETISKPVKNEDLKPEVMSKSEAIEDASVPATEEEKKTVETILPNISERLVLVDSEKVDLAATLKDDTGAIKEIKVLETTLNAAEPGTYDVTYIVTVYTDQFQEAVKAVQENKEIEKVTPAADAKTTDIKIVEKAKVIDQKEADQLVKDGKEVIATEGKIYNPEQKEESKTSSSTTSEPKQESKTETKKTEPSKTESTGGTNKTSGSNTASTPKPASGSSSSGQSAPASGSGSTNSQPVHVHNWVPVTKTVHHDAVTQQVWVQDSAAWDEPVFEEQPVYEVQDKGIRCRYCGNVFASVEEWSNHSNAMMDQEDYNHGSWEVIMENVQVGTQQVQTGTIHHDATGHYETEVVSPAWDETITTGYRCSECGSTK